MVSGDRCSAAYSGVNVEIGDNKVSTRRERLSSCPCVRSALESGGRTPVMATLEAHCLQTSWVTGQTVTLLHRDIRV